MLTCSTGQFEKSFRDTMNKKKAILWALHELVSLKYATSRNTPEVVQDTPWSYVGRFLTSDGHIYLKHTPPQLSIEVSIIKLLHDQFKAPVPEVIAHNEKLNCFLMKDAGQSLRGILKQQFDEDLLIKVVEQFAALQISVADNIHALLDIGVPDYRLDNLPELYLQLISKTDVLIADGLSETELGQLKNLHKIVLDTCKKLSTYAIKQTLVQPDFNDNNALINKHSGSITIVDLGEIVISHPFFSLINFLYVIRKHHNLTETSEAYLRVKDTCFKPFNLPKKDLSEAMRLAQVLFFVYSALANERLMYACGKENFTGEFQRHGRPSTPLRELLKIHQGL